MVAPDRQGMARGTLYLDDGKSFDYQQGSKLYIEITWDNGRLESKLIESGKDLCLQFNTWYWLVSPQALIINLHCSPQALKHLSGWRKSW